jgi:hypothetical protein
VPTNTSTSGGVTLSGGAVSSANSSAVTVSLTEADANRVKKNSVICTDAENTFLFYTNDTVKDIAGNAIVGAVVPAKPTVFTADSKAPAVTGFGLDMSTGEIAINFTETINASSMVATLIGIQSSGSGGILISLDDSSVLPTVDSEAVVITIANSTLNALKLNTGIATASNISFLQINGSGVLDMNQVPIAAQTVATSQFTADSVAPELDSFELDMRNGF